MYYTVTDALSLSSAGEVLTLQVGATAANNKKVYVDGIYVFADAAATFTLERDGTAATTTGPSAPTPLRKGQPAATSVYFTASNVGSGTVLGKYGIPAGGYVAFGLDDFGFLDPNGGSQNLTIRVDSMTGNLKIVVKFHEEAYK